MQFHPMVKLNTVETIRLSYVIFYQNLYNYIEMHTQIFSRFNLISLVLVVVVLGGVLVCFSDRSYFSLSKVALITKLT